MGEEMLIEMVCTYNNTRSPIAEATAKKMIFEAGLQDKFGVSSSGTKVDLSGIKDLAGFLRPYVDKAVENGLMAQDRIEKIRENPKSVLDEIVKLEVDWRNKYILDNLGLDYSGLQRKQTILRPETNIILPVGKENLGIVKKIYGNYKGVEIKTDFADPSDSLKMGDIKCYSDYETLASKVEAVTKSVMSKILKY
jgi:protein-tyrosine-phosphatase